MEEKSEQGFAHFVEHMVFRGTRNYADGEGIRVWQRLGASFGADTNAFTTLTHTVYNVDLPVSDSESALKALLVLADMMTNAKFEPSKVRVEQKVVLRELAIRNLPLMDDIQKKVRGLFLSGLRAAQRNIIGTQATIEEATPQRLKAFYRRWYRPERMTVVITGAGEPTAIESIIRSAFERRSAEGEMSPNPSPGTPSEPAEHTAISVLPNVPASITFGWTRQRKEGPWTRRRQQDVFIRTVATKIMESRLSRGKRERANYLMAQSTFSDANSVAEQYQIIVIPSVGAWRRSLESIFAVINQSAAGGPSDSEVNDAIETIKADFARLVESRSSISSSQLADEMITAIDQGDVPPDIALYEQMFGDMRPQLTPSRIAAELRALVAGEPRVFMVTPEPLPGGRRGFASAVDLAKTSSVKADKDIASPAERRLSAPVAVAASHPASPSASQRELTGRRVQVREDVGLVFKHTDLEPGSAQVWAFFGGGLSSTAANGADRIWSAPLLAQSGFGILGGESRDRLIEGRWVDLNFVVGEDRFALGGGSASANLATQLRLIVEALWRPQLQRADVERFVSEIDATYNTLRLDPMGVLDLQSALLLHGKDRRFRLPLKEEVRGLSGQQFRSFWSPILKAGPTTFVIIGDLGGADVIKLLADAVKEMPRRIADSPDGDRATSAFVTKGKKTFFHVGSKKEVALLLAWPLRNVLRESKDEAALHVAAAILQDRLTRNAREVTGAAYVLSVSAIDADTDGNASFQVRAQTSSESVGEFEKGVYTEVRNLIKTRPSADEMKRASSPLTAARLRARGNNIYWIEQISSGRIVAESIGRLSEAEPYAALNAEDVRRALVQHLSADRVLQVHVRAKAGGPLTRHSDVSEHAE